MATSAERKAIVQSHPSPANSSTFWGKYIFSSDHKVIGIQYGFAGLFFLLFGFFLVLVMRWQMAYPGSPVPFVGGLLEKAMGEPAEGGVVSAQLYNMFGAMHGTIMVFMGVVPVAFAGFGNYFVPLQIGAPDMAFPRLNMASFWLFFMACITMSVSFVIPGGPAQAGWTAYSPLATTIPTDGQTIWLIGMVLLITSSLLGAVNFLVTIIQMRAPGMSWLRLPFFVWTQLITALLLLLAFPPLEAAGLLQLMDKVLETSFFIPSGLLVSGQELSQSGGGNPLLWQHLFWFLGHPEVYVLLLPAIGIITEVIANNTRKPIWGYKYMVASVIVLAFVSFFVWAHHMYLTGMGTVISSFFQTTTMIISIPSVIILSCLLVTLWGGAIRFNTAMLFALAFLPMFGIGGLTGLPLGISMTDVALHDSYYVIGHFHYVVAPGILFGLFAGVYYWFPKMTGRLMDERLGRMHFWATLIFMNVVFLPMFAQGMAGMSRRMADGGATYALSNNPAITTGAFSDLIMELNVYMTAGAVCLIVAQLPFIVNLFVSLKKGMLVTSDNPWDATTLEWETPTPPGHGNFVSPVKVFRPPYEYSVPQHDKDYLPQSQPGS
ncbi:MAG: cytochrome C oxidase subunit I [Verrucomicrobiales bacterium]|jgi:cytochrome c oxidase subunit 1|nr:cytochrome C oxidase subunit I [Verrucomicrobiales bacterium]MDP6678259.1 cbb3-type cytochrome c oxidase subunit I [Verrucomicrobiota bacterium]MDP6753035.1 cbb3-type cytochrome c oxidase subunit I [Verrucomicrobiota bacterium]